MFFFTWLRATVKNAVLAGIEDAALEIAGQDTADTASAVTSLRNRVLAPTAEQEEEPEATEPVGKKKKA